VIGEACADGVELAADPTGIGVLDVGLPLFRAEDATDFASLSSHS
jgi:hypothetical protein